VVAVVDHVVEQQVEEELEVIELLVMVLAPLRGSALFLTPGTYAITVGAGGATGSYAVPEEFKVMNQHFQYNICRWWWRWI
jgi:hypothetical protein